MTKEKHIRRWDYIYLSEPNHLCPRTSRRKNMKTELGKVYTGLCVWMIYRPICVNDHMNPKKETKSAVSNILLPVNVADSPRGI